MLLISHRFVTINATKVLHSNGIVGFYYKMCYLILYMILWYQKIIDSSSTVLILTKINQTDICKHFADRVGLREINKTNL
jgi:hypothetical protein